jgi:hypothetical protein
MKNLLEPVQPSTSDWAFVDELKAKSKRTVYWFRKTAHPEELDLTQGVKILKKFPDCEGLLDTAWCDLENFFSDISIPMNQQGIEIEATKEEQDSFESYCIEITKEKIEIKSGDLEGIRRGIFYLEDLILSSEGPFLKPATIRRKPWINNRISRCFFGPIKRPPLNRDELMDEVDYYPDEYLNKLAHESINALWITVEFRDICKSDLVPEYGKNRERRLKKLRLTVDKCRRYGIKVFIFAIEPRIWGIDDPLLKNNPEIGGARSGNEVCFCPFTEASKKYLYDAVKSIFLDVPKLGGIISITHGERRTTCLSSVSSVSEDNVNCPRCSYKEKGEILEATHSIIIKAMREINPQAQFISWFYMPFARPLAEWVYTMPEKLPKDTVLVFNFESGGEKEQLGKIRVGADYWQSYVGPSCRFAKIAEISQKAGIKMGAKLQVGNSHEVATIPFVPVPPVMWKKYKALYSLNVTNVIQSWYFGNYPGIMNKIAGELAFEAWEDNNKYQDRPQIEYDFLYRLAKIEWGSHAPKIVKAWYYFYNGYNNYPMSTLFQCYGPMHDGVVWPLHLFPVHTPLAPTWKLDFPTSGDSIGECILSFTIKEIIELCEDMVRYWEKGVNILKTISPFFKNNLERLKDIGVAEALGIQFESGLNIMKFYNLREQILWGSPLVHANDDLNNHGQSGSDEIAFPYADSNNKSSCLEEMEAIVKEEIKLSLKMFELCKFDSRLGFHSEAEGYKYYPEKLLWRVECLKRLLKNEFPKMRELVSGTEQQKLSILRLTTPLNAPVYNCLSSKVVKSKMFEWSANTERKTLFIKILCYLKLNDIKENNNNNNKDTSKSFVNLIEDQLFLHIKAGDLGYPCNFKIDLKKAMDNVNMEIPLDLNERFFYKTKLQKSNLVVEFKLDIEKMPGYMGQSALAMSIVRNIKTDKGEFQDSWSGENPHIRSRLIHSVYNPEAMGRLELV